VGDARRALDTALAAQPGLAHAAARSGVALLAGGIAGGRCLGRRRRLAGVRQASLEFTCDLEQKFHSDSYSTYLARPISSMLAASLPGSREGNDWIRLTGGDRRYAIHTLHVPSKTAQPDGRFVALLAAAIAGCVHLWAQNIDTPIIIADGSLTIESRGVPWADWAAPARIREFTRTPENPSPMCDRHAGNHNRTVPINPGRNARWPCATPRPILQSTPQQRQGCRS